MGRRVDFKSAGADFGAAVGAPTILVLVDAFKRCFYAGALQQSAALGFLRHLLALYQIHAGEASDGLLIKRDGGAFIISSGVQSGDLSQSLLQTISRFRDGSVQNLLPVSG